MSLVLLRKMLADQASQLMVLLLVQYQHHREDHWQYQEERVIPSADLDQVGPINLGGTGTHPLQSVPDLHPVKSLVHHAK